MLERITSVVRRIAWTIVVLVLVFASDVSGMTRSVSAADPVALIVGMNGGVTEPVFQVFSEVPNGTELKLEQGARVTFLHYQRCEEITVESGFLTIRAGTYRVVGGQVVGRTARGCPKTGVLPSSSEIGGVLFRGDDALQLSPSSTIVITGPGADSISRARIEGPFTAADRSIAVSGGVLEMQAFDTRLRVGEEYQLELLKSSGAPAMRINVLSALTHDGVAVIRVE